jgi:hypothetical protein
MFLPATLDEAIWWTVVYADIFDYPLTLAELHHYLIGWAASSDAVRVTVRQSAWLGQRLMLIEDHVVCRDRAALVARRAERAAHSRRLWPHARRWAAWMGRVPFVRMVAVTGALAMDNAPAHDDIDYFVVTTPGRTWLARALIIGLVRIARWWGVGLCPNYLLAQTALAQTQRDLYTAHDLAQMVPLMGHPVYAEFRAANAWAADHLPQATRPLRAEPDLAPTGWAATLKAWGERLLGGSVGHAFEHWERHRKTRKFAPAAQRAAAEVVLDAEHIKGHFDQHGRAVLQKFHERLQW